MGNFLSGEPARLTRSRGPGAADHFIFHFQTTRFRRAFLYSGETLHAV
jgi:hypothetical protein